MDKDFDAWNSMKKEIHSNAVKRIFFHPRELWFARLGANVGFEQDGGGKDFLRPMLVLRKFNNEVCWVLPLTTRDKRGNPYYARFEYVGFPEKEGSESLISIAVLSQLRLIDAKRFRYKIGTVHEGEFQMIKEKVRRLLA